MLNRYVISLYFHARVAMTALMTAARGASPTVLGDEVGVSADDVLRTVEMTSEPLPTVSI